jgi:hypothetical protein
MARETQESPTILGQAEEVMSCPSGHSTTPGRLSLLSSERSKGAWTSKPTNSAHSALFDEATIQAVNRTARAILGTSENKKLPFLR